MSSNLIARFFFSFGISEYNAAVACLLWEQKVVCSNHPIPKRLSSTKAVREIANLDIRVRIPSWLSTLFTRKLIGGVKSR